MKDLKTYVLEGFKLGKNKVSKTIEYKYFPKNENELRIILRKRLAKDNDADLNDIDVSNIDDMINLFTYLDPHNIDISEWNVSKVVDMRYMFYNCENFNSDLSNWDVSNVKWMDSMFYGCNSLKNKPIWYKE